MSAEEAFLGFGANLPSLAGAPDKTIFAALAELGRNGVVPLHSSRLYASPAWPNASDPFFTNAVVRVQTTLSPGSLLALLHATETAFGRTRSARNAPRPLDIDILDFNSRISTTPPILPHPRMQERAFVLIPLKEIAKDWRHPVSGRSIDCLIEALPFEARASVIPREA